MTGWLFIKLHAPLRSQGRKKRGKVLKERRVSETLSQKAVCASGGRRMSVQTGEQDRRRDKNEPDSE